LFVYGVRHVWERRDTYRILVGKMKENQEPLRRPRPRWKDNTKTDIKRNEWKGVDWILVVQ
jgi:hypothetical protein